MKAGFDQMGKTDYLGNLHQSANLAEQWAGADPNLPPNTHGAATANPFANLAAMQAGTPASGTVVAVTPTGQEVAGTPVYAVELDVRIDGQETYRTTYQTVIAAGALANWQPGAVYPFKVSPTDPHALMLG